jgi:hypothetical protein
MRRTRLFLATLVLMIGAGCATSQLRTQGNNNGSSQPNQSGQPVTAENGTPQANNPTGPSVEPAPKPQGETEQAASNSAAPAKPVTDLAPAVTPAAKAPKLVVPASTLNFGKQPQDKKLLRTISIRNSGSADLHIESVAPS